jgi:drug/metabolite transporter (DMT)-like permease
MELYFLMAFLAVILTAFAQVLLKAGANRNKHHNNLVKQYFNIYVISGYGLFLLTTVLSVYAYRILPLKYAIIFLPFTFIFVILFSIFFFKEPLAKRQIISFLIILTGIIIYNL